MNLTQGYEQLVRQLGMAHVLALVEVRGSAIRHCAWGSVES